MLLIAYRASDRAWEYVKATENALRIVGGTENKIITHLTKKCAGRPCPLCANLTAVYRTARFS
jgi:hypothetical protein